MIHSAARLEHHNMARATAAVAMQCKGKHIGSFKFKLPKFGATSQIVADWAALLVPVAALQLSFGPGASAQCAHGVCSCQRHTRHNSTPTA